METLMRDDSKRYPHDAPVETEGMGGAGGGDLDDVGDVGFPRNATGRDVTRGRGVPEGMGGAGGGDIDDVGDVGNPDELQAAGFFPTGTGEDIEIAREMGGGSLDTLPEIPTGDMDVDDIRNTSRAGSETISGDTGVVTGITTGVDTDDDAEGPGSPWENLDDGLRESNARGTDTPTS
jgi:hypothetical protein